MKNRFIAGLLIIFFITGCVSSEEHRRQQAKKQAVREANTRAFCAKWSQIKPGMTYEEVDQYFHMSFDQDLVCSIGAEIKTSHSIFKFDKSYFTNNCKLKRATTEVACDNPVIEKK